MTRDYEISKKELLAALRSPRKLFSNVVYNSDNCGYFQLVKKDFMEAVKEMPDETTFDASINETSIYIN